MDNPGERTIPNHWLLTQDGRPDALGDQTVQHSSDEPANVRRERFANEGLDGEPGASASAEPKQQPDDLCASHEPTDAR